MLSHLDLLTFDLGFMTSALKILSRSFYSNLQKSIVKKILAFGHERREALHLVSMI